MTWLALLGWLLVAALVVAWRGSRRRLEQVARAEHELRGPLAVIALGAEQVRRGRTGPDLAGVLEAQLHRFQSGLEDLGAALGRGRGDRPPARIALERVARHTAAGWTSVAAREGRRVHLDWRAGSVMVAADRGRIAQALGNVLSNALEHGRGEVEVRGRRVDGAVRIEVADQGRPTSPPPTDGPGLRENGPRRTPGPRRRRSPAADRGRGLSIATSAVEEAGGRLELLTGRHGTTAALELPLDER